MENYEKKGIDFLEKAKAKMDVKLLGHFPYFDGDKESRDVYQITFTRENKKPWIFRFGNSIAESMTKDRKERMQNMTLMERSREFKKVKPPSAYGVLSCITKDDPGIFEDFCSSFGYDTDSRKAEKTYFAVQKEYSECFRVFGDLMEELQEIN